MGCRLTVYGERIMIVWEIPMGKHEAQLHVLIGKHTQKVAISKNKTTPPQKNKKETKSTEQVC